MLFRSAKLATRHKRVKGGKPKENPEAQEILLKYHYDIEDDYEYDPLIQKITDMPDGQNVEIINKDVRNLSLEDRQHLVKSLDFESYLNLVENKFNKNWKNTIIK